MMPPIITHAPVFNFGDSIANRTVETARKKAIEIVRLREHKQQPTTPCVIQSSPSGAEAIEVRRRPRLNKSRSLT